MKYVISILLLFSLFSHAEERRSIENNLSSLANIIIPTVDFPADTTINEAVIFLNLILRSPDPPPPKQWKIRLEVTDNSTKINKPIIGKDLYLYQVIGMLSDRIGAEVLITRDGYIIRESKPLEKDAKTKPVKPIKMPNKAQ